jgi:hypothetical protein
MKPININQNAGKSNLKGERLISGLQKSGPVDNIGIARKFEKV